MFDWLNTVFEWLRKIRRKIKNSFIKRTITNTIISRIGALFQRLKSSHQTNSFATSLLRKLMITLFRPTMNNTERNLSSWLRLT